MVLYIILWGKGLPFAQIEPICPGAGLSTGMYGLWNHLEGGWVGVALLTGKCIIKP